MDGWKRQRGFVLGFAESIAIQAEGRHLRACQAVGQSTFADQQAHTRIGEDEGGSLGRRVRFEWDVAGAAFQHGEEGDWNVQAPR